MADPSSAAPVSGDGTPVTTKRGGETLAFPAVLFGRYRVQGELGRGGMGLVLLSMDEELGHPVAVKVIPELVVRDTEAIADLKKEVLRGMALQHPNIVRTHTFERDAAMAAIIMEYVEGQTLADLRAQQADSCFDPPDILPWLEQLCPVLDYAHREAKIAHRDLKPRNLMLTPAGRLKVADFGISSQINDSLTRLTTDGRFSGTPPYMSPQQAMGEHPSHLDDIYAVGATIYELLTSKPPFFRGHILSQVMQATVPTMAERRRELGLTGRRPLPPAWEQTVADCLAKKPSDRPQSGGDILQGLKAGRASFTLPAGETLIPQAPAKATPDQYSYRPIMPPPQDQTPTASHNSKKFELRRRLRRRRWIAVGLLALGLSAALGWSAWRWMKNDTSKRPVPPSPVMTAATPAPAYLLSPLRPPPGPLTEKTSPTPRKRRTQSHTPTDN